MSNIPDDVIIPPLDVRSMIEKTAQYVARHGVAFENKIRTKESQNPKFVFINKNDPYNGYYKYSLELFKTNGILPKVNEIKHQIKDAAINQDTINVPLVVDPNPFHTLKIVNGQLSDIEREMTLSDLNVLKLMAKYTVQYGESTIESLKSRIYLNEGLNSHFAFLQPDNRFHEIYLRYIDVYKLLLIEKDTLIKGIEQFVTKDEWKQDDFLNSCFALAEQVKAVQSSQREAEKKKNDRLLAYTTIDWQSFSIVETIEFTDSDQYEKPLTRDTLKYRALIQREANKVIDEELVHDTIYDIDGEDEDEETVPSYDNGDQQETSDLEEDQEEKEKEEGEGKQLKHRAPKGMKIKSAGESRLKRKNNESSNINNDGERMLTCPLTGKVIPESQFQTHLSTLLRDPKYEEEKARYEAKFKYGDNLTSTQAWENIKSLVEEDRQTKRFKSV